jgi:hypothetical protein
MKQFNSFLILSLVISILATFVSSAETNLCLYQFPDSYDGTGQTVTDLSGRGNDATTLMNTNSYVEEAPSGKSGGSFDATAGPNDFNTDATLLLENSILQTNNGYSYEVWFKWNGEGSNNKIIDYAGTESLRINGDAELLFGAIETSIAQGYLGWDIIYGPLEADQWYHIIATFDSEGNSLDENGALLGNAKLFIDDELVAFTNNVKKGTYGDELNRKIGYCNHPNRYAGNEFNGLIHNPRVTLGVIPMDIWPDPPPNVQASDGTFPDKVLVTWDISVKSNATRYVVFRNTENNSAEAEDISGELDVTNQYNDTSAVPGELYYYWVQAGNNFGFGPLSTSDSGYRQGTIDPPDGVTASDGTFTDHVHVSWNSVASATRYAVYRNTSDSLEGITNLAASTTGTQFDDTSAEPGRTYHYRVKAGTASSWSFFSDADTGYTPAQLLAWYALDELEGTNATDSSAHDFGGYYRDDCVLGMESVNEMYNTAVGFNIDLTFGDILIPSNTPVRQLVNSFTVALWAKPDELELGNQVFIGNPQVGIGWIFGTTGERLKFTTWSVKDYISDGSILSNGQWTHLAVTMNGENDIQFYVDGSPFETLKPGVSPANYGVIDTFIGSDGADAYSYFGVLDEVHVYQGVLSPEEIAELAVIPEPAILPALAAGLLLIFRHR